LELAIYSTFFLCEPENLAAGFPGWREPLARPVRREVHNPFTGDVQRFESREPDWSDDEENETGDCNQGVSSRRSPFGWLRDLLTWPSKTGFTVRSINGNYADYLNQRVLPFIQQRPHVATKGLTQTELEPLVETMGLTSRLENALYAHPEWASELVEVPRDIVKMLAGLDHSALTVAARRWARAMSTPEHMLSAAGTPLNEGWTEADAMVYLGPLVELSRKVHDGQTMYLLMEA
jgi:hypothetical protein